MPSVVSFIRHEVRGTGVGVASAVGRIGAMLGPVIAGQLLTAGFGAAGVITAAIPCIIISAVMLCCSW